MADFSSKDWSKREGQFKSTNIKGIQTERRRSQTASNRKQNRQSQINKRRQISEYVEDYQLTKEENYHTASQALALVLNTQVLNQFKSGNDVSDSGLQALKTISKCLAHTDFSPVEFLLTQHPGFIESFGELLKTPQDDVQLEVLRCLINITADEQCPSLQQLSCTLPSLILILSSGNLRLGEQACWVLGNLAAIVTDGEEDRSSVGALAVISAGVIHPVLSILTKASPSSFNHQSTFSPISNSLVCTAFWLLCNILANSRNIPIKDVFRGLDFVSIQDLFVKFLWHDDINVCAECGWLLSLWASRDDSASLMLQSDLCITCLFQALDRFVNTHDGVVTASSVAAPAASIVRTFGHLISISEEFSNTVVSNTHACQALFKILKTCEAVLKEENKVITSSCLQEITPSFSSFGIFKESIWLVSNMCAGAAIEHRILILERLEIWPILLYCLVESSSMIGYDVQKQALFTTANLIGTERNGIMLELIQQQNIRQLIDSCISLLKAPDNEAIYCSICILDTVVRYGKDIELVQYIGGLGAIEACEDLGYKANLPPHVASKISQFIDIFYTPI